MDEQGKMYAMKKDFFSEGGSKDIVVRYDNGE